MVCKSDLDAVAVNEPLLSFGQVTPSLHAALLLAQVRLNVKSLDAAAPCTVLLTLTFALTSRSTRFNVFVIVTSYALTLSNFVMFGSAFHRSSAVMVTVWLWL